MSTPLAGALVLVLGGSILAGAQPAPKKVDIVSVTGCLREQAQDTWMLVAATEPVPSLANAPPPEEIPTSAPAGTQRYQLIGVGEFKLPTLKDRTLVVKGLFIKDAPVSRINVTSVVEAVATCAASAPK
jgi:hypothetical protein